MYSEEQIQRAVNTDIMAFAESKGFECKRQGSEYRISGYGGLVINPEKNSFYIHSRQEGGHGCINFCRKVLGMDFKEALSELVGGESIEYKPNFKRESVIKEKIKFEQPKPASDCKRVYAYLINQRGISANLITELIRNKLLYQDMNGNAVFLHRDKDGKAIGADVQGTLSEKRYKGIVPGSDGTFTYQKGITYDKVFLFEAPIDLISYVQMHPEVTNACFVSMGGLKPNKVAEYLNNDKLKIVSCVDNDIYGKRFNNRILFEKMTSKFKDVPLEERKIDVNDDVSLLYSVIKKDDKTYSLFIDAEDMKSLDSIEGTPMKWKNTSNFIVDTECKDNNVKDFNELLKKSANNELIEKTDKINTWATKIEYKIADLSRNTKENLR